MRNRALFLAGLLSFAIYLLPIWTPHAIFLLGPAIWAMAAWDEGLAAVLPQMLGALALQAVLFAVLYLFFRRISLGRGLIVLISLPVLAFVGEVTFLLAIPALIMVDFDRSAESGNWPVACRVEDASLHQVFHNVGLGLEQAGQAWLRLPGEDPAESRFALLTMPDCQVRPRLQIRDLLLSSRDVFAPDGALLYWTHERASGEQKLWVLPADDDTPQAIEIQSEALGWSPLLSSDGQAIAWSARLEDGRSGVQIQNLADNSSRFVPVERASGETLEPLLLDLGAERLVLRKRHNEALEVDFSGRVVRGPLTLESPLDASFRLRWPTMGWVASSFPLDDDEAVMIAWDLPSGEGWHRIPKGRGLNSLSVDPAGRYIAISVDQSTRLFGIKSAVYVLDARDGKELYRRFYRPYTRATVAFLGEDYLAFDHGEGDGRVVEVLRLPESES